MKIKSSMLLAGIFFLSGCKQDTLLEGLEQSQANEVVALLQKNNVDVVKSQKLKDGFNIYVNQSDFSAAVDLITQYNLPSKKRSEISDFFPADSLVTSPRVEIAKINSAIEQRLEHTLAQIQNVATASVHVSYDVRNGNSREKKSDMHISALIKHYQDTPDKNSLLIDAKRILKNSFSDISYENISVVLTSIDDIQQLKPQKIKTTNSSDTLNYIIKGAMSFFAMFAFYLLWKRNRDISVRER